MTNFTIMRMAIAILPIAMAGTAASAQTQSKYFAREKLVGLSTSPTTPPKAKSCGSLAPSMTASNGPTVRYTGTATTLEEAQSVCESAFASTGLTNASCLWVNLKSAGTYQTVRLFTPATIGPHSSSDIYATTCTK